MQTVPLNVLTYNGHAGIPIRHGAIEWLLDRTRPDVVLLQESIDTAAMHKALPPSEWHYAPTEQPGRQGTYVVARKSRFDLIDFTNEDVTFGEKHLRRRPVARLRDRKTGRIVVASSIHVAPLGAGFVDANPAARRRHERQVQAWADRFEHVGEGKVAIVAGDVNERISATYPKDLVLRTAVGRLGKARLRPSSALTGQEAHLDDVFVRPDDYVTVGKRVTLRPPVEGNDHPAVAVRLDVTPIPEPVFTAATWNVFYGTNADENREALRRLRKKGVSLFLLQELSTPEVRKMIREEGLKLAYAPRQYGIAWDATVWERVGQAEEIDLSTTTFYTTSGHPMGSSAVRVVLRHKPTGRTVDALSYHTPAGVQKPSGRTVDALSYHTPAGVQTPSGPDEDGVPRRVQVLRESMATLKRLADEGLADAVLYGGDDNVDERRGPASEWAFMGEKATGLRQVIAPDGTHGKRSIDDFRVRGLKPLDGDDVPTPSDHDAHVRVFRFRK